MKIKLVKLVKLRNDEIFVLPAILYNSWFKWLELCFLKWCIYIEFKE